MIYLKHRDICQVRFRKLLEKKSEAPSQEEEDGDENEEDNGEDNDEEESVVVKDENEEPIGTREDENDHMVLDDEDTILVPKDLTGEKDDETVLFLTFERNTAIGSLF